MNYQFFKVRELGKGLEVVTPPVELSGFVALSKPSTKFNPNGVYTVQFKLDKDSPVCTELVSILDSEHQKAYQLALEDKNNQGKRVKQADVPYFEVLDENKKPTGEICFKLKREAKRETKDGIIEFRPKLIDSQKQPIPSNILISGGTVARLAFIVSPYFTAALGSGITLKLLGAQILKLEQFSTGSDFETLFDIEEEGYVYEDSVEDQSDQSGDRSDESYDF